MKTKIIHGLLITMNMGAFFLVSNVDYTLILPLAALAPLMTIAFFFYIKLFNRDSMLFHDISIKQAVIVIAILILFILAGVIRKNHFFNSVIF